MLSRNTRTELDGPPLTRTGRRLARKARNRRRAIQAGTSAAVACMAAVIGFMVPALTAGQAALTVSNQGSATPGAAYLTSKQVSAPTALIVHTVDATKVSLSWQESTRKAGMRFRIDRNGRLIATTTKTSFTDSHAWAGRRNIYRVSATDGGGAVSPPSAPVTVPSSDPTSTPTAQASPTAQPSPSASPQASPTASATASPTASASASPSPSASASSSSGVASPAGVAGASNTGYAHAPGYSGSLGNCSGITIQSNTTYSDCSFPGGVSVGSSGSPVSNVTFSGDDFIGNNPQGALVLLFGNNITFSYDTFQPDLSAPPATSTANYEYGLEADGAYYTHVGQLEVDHSNLWGFGNAIDVTGSTQSAPQVYADNYIHDADTLSAQGYHVDGIGDLNSGDTDSYVTITGNTIVSAGNTNGIAYQYGPYDHFTITDNYFSGFGYMIHIGPSGPTDSVFENNVWGTDVEPDWGPMYGWDNSTNTWSGNKIDVVPGTTWMASANNGLYWWPTDGNPSSPSQVVGHTTDYSGS
jgi:hypothetical protein